jgi:hypothetical protein
MLVKFWYGKEIVRASKMGRGAKLGTGKIKARLSCEYNGYCSLETLLQSQRIASGGLRHFCPEEGSRRLLSTKFVSHLPLQVLFSKLSAPINV